MKHNGFKEAVLLLLTGATLCTLVYAADSQDTAQPDNDVVKFENIEPLVRANNLSAQAITAAISSLNSFNREAAFKKLQDTYSGLSDLSFYDTSLAGRAAITIEQTTMWDELEALKADNYAKTYEDTLRSLDNGMDRLIQAAQSTYIGIFQMEQKLADADRGMNQLTRTETRLNLMQSVGLVSDTDVQTLQNQKEAAENQISSLAFQIEAYTDNLKLLLGMGDDSKLTLGGLSVVTENQLGALDFDTDLQSGLAANLDCYQAQRAAETAKDDWHNSKYQYDVGEHTYESAVQKANAAEANFKMQARIVYDTLLEKNRLVKAAQADADYEQNQYDATRVKYQVGLVSQYDLDNEKDTLEGKKAAVQEAQAELYSAWVSYQWMVKGILPSTT